MKVHTIIPYALDRNFGKALNESMALIPDGDCACILDHDVMFLTPDAIAIVHEYAEKYPDSLLTCYTNRVGNKPQLLTHLSPNDSIKHWIKVAEKQRKYAHKVTEMTNVISGFLMVISKSLWNAVGHFTEEKMILGVDNHFSEKVLNKGHKIFRMEGLIVFHIYRIINGKHDKRHLK